MIATMKKAYLVAQESKRTQALQQLRDIGVLHLEEIRGQSEELDDLYKKRAMLERAQQILPPEEGKSAQPAEDQAITHKEIEEALEIGKRVEQQQEQKSSHREAHDKLQREMERIAPLGDFDPQDIEILREKGVNLQLFVVTKEKRGDFPKDISRFEVLTEKSRSIIAAIVEDDSENLDAFPRFELPELSYTDMKQEQQRHAKEIEQIDTEMQNLVQYHGLLQRALDQFDQDIEFEQVRSGLNEEDELVYLGGFVPEQRIEKLKKGASDNGWALLIREPDTAEPIPTMVINPKPIGIIKPVFNFLGTIPGYFEYDISFYLLFFLTIFFAMIIGDAGYGAILLGTT